jgi:hypothetical protein
MPPMPARLCRFCGQPIAYIDHGPDLLHPGTSVAVRSWVHTERGDWARCSGPSAPEPMPTIRIADRTLVLAESPAPGDAA